MIGIWTRVNRSFDGVKKRHQQQQHMRWDRGRAKEHLARSYLLLIFRIRRTLWPWVHISKTLMQVTMIEDKKKREVTYKTRTQLILFASKFLANVQKPLKLQAKRSTRTATSITAPKMQIKLFLVNPDIWILISNCGFCDIAACSLYFCLVPEVSSNLFNWEFCGCCHGATVAAFVRYANLNRPRCQKQGTRVKRVQCGDTTIWVSKTSKWITISDWSRSLF